MKDLGCRVRSAIEADLQTLALLEYEQLLHHAGLDSRWMRAVSRDVFLEKWMPYGQHLLTDQDRLVLVAEVEGVLVGYLVAKFEPPPDIVVSTARLHVDDVYVAPEQREKGTGTALLERASSWANSRGADRITLEVMAANAPARAFYTSLGFETAELRMRKAI